MVSGVFGYSVGVVKVVVFCWVGFFLREVGGGESEFFLESFGKVLL